MDKLVIGLLIATVSLASCYVEKSASDVAFEIYAGCVQHLSISCVQPKAMAWITTVVGKNEIPITEEMSLVRTAPDVVLSSSSRHAKDAELNVVDKFDNFLATHALKIKGPEFFSTDEGRSMIPDFLNDNLLTKGGLVPLSDDNPKQEGRGFMKKVLLPFLLGLKFKTTVMVPLALALIALKTWKAMTLGLLSLVLSGALVIFKIAKPKIVNYEVVHYPHHVDHVEHVPHHVEHIVPHHVEHHIEHVPHHVEHHVEHVPHHVESYIAPHFEHVEHIEHIDHPSQGWEPAHSSWARSSVEAQDAQDLAYAGQQPQRR